MQSAGLLPDRITRAEVERDLKLGPHPASCPLRFDNAEGYLKATDAALEGSQAALREALNEKARLFASPALRQRLEAGRGEAFIAGILALAEVDALREYLVEQLGGEEEEPARQKIELLQKYLRKISVRRVSFGDFKPSLRTIEARDIGAVTEEFKQFLTNQLRGAGEDDAPVIEVE